MSPFGRGEQGRERTAAEREAARLERERRRALREGRPPPEELTPTDQPRAPFDADALGDRAPLDATAPSDRAPFDAEAFDSGAPLDNDAPANGAPRVEDRTPLDPDAPANGAPPVEDRTPLDPEAPANGAPPLEDAIGEPTWEPFAHEPDPEPIPSARERPAEREPPAGEEPTPAAPERDPVAADEPAARDPLASPGAPEPHEPEPQHTQPLEPVPATRTRRTVSLPRPQTEDHQTDSWDKPIGTVRRSRAQYQPQPGAPGMPPHRNIGVPTKTRRRWARRMIALAAILILAGVAVVAVLLFQPFHSKGYDAVVVTIPPGSSTGEIGDLLAKKGVVDSGFFFEIRARIGGDRGKLRAGTYTLKKSMSYSDALAALTAAPKAAPTVKITLPEGPSRTELAARVKQAGIRGNYVTASAQSGLLKPRDYGAPKGTKSLEGFLFPDTYELASATATAKGLVNQQLRTFKREFAKVDLKRAKQRNLSRYDVVTIASMIEREALVPKDRRLISAVIYNRLRRGMPLGIDATLRYRLDNWSRPLKQSELDTNSAYNTRKVQGLPPTPIGNPGLAALQAAANPANVKYLFYVVKPCGNGAHAFSSTDAQFQKDVAAYDEARAKRGGKDPSRC